MTYPPYGPPHVPPPPNNGWKIFGGVLIGVVSTVVLPFASIGLARWAGFGIILLPLALVPVIGGTLLVSPASRPWGTGMLIGWAVALVVAAGACVALLNSLA
jgi:hypothetical protein